MIRPALPALALALLLVPLAAAPASAEDPRLVERVYDPGAIVRIDGRAKVQATIMFGDDEAIENVAVGDSSAWQITPNKRASLLFVKPLAARATTNMTVVTTKRTYLFDLVASPSHNPLYVMRFSYPELERERAEQLAAAQESANSVELQAAQDPYAVLDPAELNFAWARDGDDTLLPDRAYDNGMATFLSWPSDVAVPAILVTDHEGTEGPVNFTVRGDTIVVEGVPRQIVLRMGDEAATLTNTGPVKPKRTANDPALAQAVENN
jgi:type IV secretion system protein VirB9